MLKCSNLLFLLEFIRCTKDALVGNPKSACDITDLPKLPDKFKWHCLIGHDLGESCRISCVEEGVANENIITTCTHQGWIPNRIENVERISCKPHTCATPHQIQNSQWKCRTPSDKSCYPSMQDSIGEICELICMENTSTRKESICTTEGWIPELSSLTCDHQEESKNSTNFEEKNSEIHTNNSNPIMNNKEILPNNDNDPLTNNDTVGNDDSIINNDAINDPLLDDPMNADDDHAKDLPFQTHLIREKNLNNFADDTGLFNGHLNNHIPDPLLDDPMKADDFAIHHIPDNNQKFINGVNPSIPPYIPSIYSNPFGQKSIDQNIPYKKQNKTMFEQKDEKNKKYNLLDKRGPKKGIKYEKQNTNKNKKDPNFIYGNAVKFKNITSPEIYKQKSKHYNSLTKTIKKGNKLINPSLIHGVKNGQSDNNKKYKNKKDRENIFYFNTEETNNNKPHENVDGIDKGMPKPAKCGIFSELVSGKCICKTGYAGNEKICGPDSDLDGYPDYDLPCKSKQCKKDNCIKKENPRQTDEDGDGIGDECDHDRDNDGVVDDELEKPVCSRKHLENLRLKIDDCKKDAACYTKPKSIKPLLLAQQKCKFGKVVVDNCPNKINPGQEDRDGDLVGDACDNCINVFNPFQFDLNEDGAGDDCVKDKDGDTIPDEQDNCPEQHNPKQKDSDMDGIGDICDNCKNLPNADQVDFDQSGVGDACEIGRDIDGDGVANQIDNCKRISNPSQIDTDEDNIGDHCDKDIDGDGINNEQDVCPLVPVNKQVGSSEGSECLDDSDGDGVTDDIDVCPFNRFIHESLFYSTMMTKTDMCSVEKYLSKDLKSQCRKAKAKWEDRKNGTELYQSVNCRPTIAINSNYSFEDVEYNGTLYISDQMDNDWVGFVFGYQNMFTYYIVIANMHDKGTPKHKGTSAMWWHIKKVKVDKKEHIPLTYTVILRNLVFMESKDGYTKTLWEDPLKQQWKRRTPIKWNVVHLGSKGIIELRMYYENKEIINSGPIKDPDPIRGGKLGLYIRSQEDVLFSQLSFRCLDSWKK